MHWFISSFLLISISVATLSIFDIIAVKAVIMLTGIFGTFKAILQIAVPNTAYKTDVISLKSSAETMAKMRQEFIFYKRAYNDVSQNALWQYMLEYFVKRYETEVIKKIENDVLDTQLRYSIRLYCYGCVGMTKEWLLYDNTTSAETVVKMMFESMPDMMKRVYFN